MPLVQLITPHSIPISTWPLKLEFNGLNPLDYCAGWVLQHYVYVTTWPTVDYTSVTTNESRGTETEAEKLDHSIAPSACVRARAVHFERVLV